MQGGHLAVHRSRRSRAKLGKFACTCKGNLQEAWTDLCYASHNHGSVLLSRTVTCTSAVHRSLEAQLQKAKWKCEEVTNQLRAVKEDHDRLLQYSSQQSGKAAAAQRRSATTITKLDEQLQQISEDRRNENIAASEAAAEERSRLLAQVDTLARCAWTAAFTA